MTTAPTRALFMKGLDKLAASYWLLPGLLSVGAIGLAMVALKLDRTGALEALGTPEWMLIGTAQSARALLTTISTAAVTVASLTFSIMIVSLTVAASNFGPRLLHSFMRDRKSQATLGVFLACFVYSIVVLRSVREDFTPHISVNFAIGLTLVSIGALVFFFHHVAQTIQADNIVCRVGSDLRESIGAFLNNDEETRTSASPGRSRESDSILNPHEGAASASVEARKEGVVQVIDHHQLVELAHNSDTVIDLAFRGGDFVIEGEELASVYPRENLSDELIEEINAAFILGRGRTLIQDLKFAFDQLVEVAVRALSPGINDPNTAKCCLNHIGAGLAQLMDGSGPEGRWADSEGNLRLMTREVSVPEVIASVFGPIRLHGHRDLSVLVRILEVLATLAPRARTEDVREALRRQADSVLEGAGDESFTESDRQVLGEAADLFRQGA